MGITFGNNIDILSEPSLVVDTNQFKITEILAFYSKDSSDYFIVAALQNSVALIVVGKSDHQIRIIKEFTELNTKKTVFAQVYSAENTQEAKARV